MHEEALQKAWQHVLEHWEDDEAHGRFISLCTLVGSLDDAAQRYRSVRDESPSRRKEADRRLSGIVTLSLSTLEHADGSTGTRLKRIGSALYLLSFLLVGSIALWIALVILRQ